MPTLRERMHRISEAPALIADTGNQIGKTLLLIAVGVIATAIFTLMILIKG